MEKYRLVQEHKADESDEYLDHPVATGGTGATATSSGSASTDNFPEVRITQQGKPRNYISYAMNLFVRLVSQFQFIPFRSILVELGDLVFLLTVTLTYAHIQKVDGSPTIVLKAMGRAINKAVTIAEILKRKMPLHQLNTLSSVEMTDVFEPVEEGLDVVTSRRYVSCMKITLSLTVDGMDINHSGYQTPLPEEEMHPGDYHSSSSTTTATGMRKELGVH
jgi:ribonuclease P/MRP protein subunit RPP25